MYTVYTVYTKVFGRYDRFYIQIWRQKPGFGLVYRYTWYTFYADLWSCIPHGWSFEASVTR